MMLRFRTRQLRVDSVVSRSQEIEFAAWSIGQPIDDDTIVIFPTEGQVVKVVLFHHRGGTQTLVAHTPTSNESIQTKPMPLPDLLELGKPHRG